MAGFAVKEKMEEKNMYSAPHRQDCNASRGNQTGIPVYLNEHTEEDMGLSFDAAWAHYNLPLQLDALAYTKEDQAELASDQEQALSPELEDMVIQKLKAIRANVMHFKDMEINMGAGHEPQANDIEAEEKDEIVQRMKRKGEESSAEQSSEVLQRKPEERTPIEIIWDIIWGFSIGALLGYLPGLLTGDQSNGLLQMIVGGTIGGAVNGIWDVAGKIIGTKKGDDNYILFNNNHKDSMPKPKGKGPHGGNLQSHHVLQNAWARNNLHQYGYDSQKAPTVTLETGKGLPHTIITNEQNRRKREREDAGMDKWGTTMRQELKNVVSDFLKAGFPKTIIRKVMELIYKMLDKLKVPYQKVDI